MWNPIKFCLCLLVIQISFLTSCDNKSFAKKRIEEINDARVKATKLADEAERKKKTANQRRESRRQPEHDRLIEEAADLYEMASTTLNEAADQAQEIASMKNPEWYDRYFSLQSKLFRNLAQLAAVANNELRIRERQTPSEAQVQLWSDTIDRINEENEDLRRQIFAIERWQGLVLIKR